jgi:hypothetical protein
MTQAVSLHTVTTEAQRVTGQAVWELWWTKWLWDTIFFAYVSFPLSVVFHQCSIFFHCD